jgi:hypothetical protein
MFTKKKQLRNFFDLNMDPTVNCALVHTGVGGITLLNADFLENDRFLLGHRISLPAFKMLRGISDADAPHGVVKRVDLEGVPEKRYDMIKAPAGTNVPVRGGTVTLLSDAWIICVGKFFPGKFEFSRTENVEVAQLSNRHRRAISTWVFVDPLTGLKYCSDGTTAQVFAEDIESDVPYSVQNPDGSSTLCAGGKIQQARLCEETILL